MSSTSTPPAPPAHQPVSPAFLTVCLAWLVAAGATLWLAVGWIDRPFPGFLVQENLHVSTFNMADWPAVQAGVRPWSRVVAVDGQAVATSAELYQYAGRHSHGTPLRYTFVDQQNVRSEVSVAVARFTTWDWFRFFLPFWWGGVLHLIVGGLVVYLRPDNQAARAHWVYCQAMALFLLLKVDANTTHALPLLSYLAFGPLVPGIVGLALIFPARLGSPRFRRVTMAAAWALAALFMALVPLTFYEPRLWPTVARTLIAVPALFYLGSIALWAWEALSKRIQPIERSQARVIMVGMALAFLPPIIYYALIFMGLSSGGIRLGDLTMAFFPVMVGYAIVRHRAFDIQAVIRRVTLYVGLTGGLGLLYVSSVGLGVALTGGKAGIEVHDLMAALLVAAAFHPLYRFLRHRIDRFFLGERADAVETIATFSRHRVATATHVAQDLMGLLQKAFRPRWAVLAVAGASPTLAGEPPADLPGELPGQVANGVRPLREAWPQASEEAMSIALEFGGEQHGTLLLGPPENDLPYTASDLAILAVLAHQAGAALQNSRLFESQVALAAQEALARSLAEERQALLKQVVHDIRTDLFNIQVATERARRQREDGAPLESIDRSLRRIDALLGEKTDYVRQGLNVTLGRALEASTSAMESALRLKSQHLEIAGSLAAEEVLPLSEVEAVQVLTNLLSNASKFSPVGTRIRLTIQLDAEAIAIAIADEGPGLPSELLADPTVGRRADPSQPGSGLGLQNVAAILRRVGGHLKWSNHANGTEFVAHVPRLRVMSLT